MDNHLASVINIRRSMSKGSISHGKYMKVKLRWHCIHLHRHDADECSAILITLFLLDMFIAYLTE